MIRVGKIALGRRSLVLTVVLAASLAAGEPIVELPKVAVGGRRLHPLEGVGMSARGAEVTLGHPPGALVLPTLGGTLNLVSPTGQTAPGGRLALTVGSHGRRAAEVAWGGQVRPAEVRPPTDTHWPPADTHWLGADIHWQAGWRKSEGYREHQAQTGSWVEANAGIRFGEAWRARAYLQWTRSDFEVPGAVSPALAAADPRAVSPGLVPGVHMGADTRRDRPRRESDYRRVGVRLGRTYVDFANTTWIDAVALAHLQLGGRVGPGLTWHVEVRNLFDTRHASTSIIVDQVASPLAATVIPGEGRNLRAGLQWVW